jgi:hypothetical protein
MFWFWLLVISFGGLAVTVWMTPTPPDLRKPPDKARASADFAARSKR